VIGGVHPSPFPFTDVVTTTTHKTLRGPRGGMIMVTKKGLAKDPELGAKIDRAIFPNLQGGPHNHTTAGIAVALREAATPKFRAYGRQIVKNAKALGKELARRKVALVTGGTDNHMLLVKCGAGRGAIVEAALDVIGLTTNKNTIPDEPSSPFYPSGVRLGTQALTTRGLKEKDLTRIGNWIAQVLEEVSGTKLPQTKDERKLYLDKYRRMVEKSKNLNKIKREISSFAGKFPIFAWNK